jgi:hypothetical protein
LHGDQRAAPVRRPGGPDALGITVPTTHTAWSTPIALKHLPHQPRHVGVAPSIFSPTRRTRLQEQPTFHTVCTDAHISLTKFACFDQNQNSPAHLTHRALPHSLAFCLSVHTLLTCHPHRHPRPHHGPHRRPPLRPRLRLRREPRFRAARRDRVACVVAAPRRPPGALLLLLLVRQVLPLSLWAARSGEPVLARPTGCDGRVGSRGRRCEAALGDAGSHRTSSGVYYKACHRCKRPCARSYCGLARGSVMSGGSGSSCLGSIEAARSAGGRS